jgi:pimeloyl-ACP methyl ester carboxylesterase
MAERSIPAGEVTLGADVAGEGEIPVVLLHGLTASRRYVVHGSRSLERSGHRVTAYDARGHGASSPAPAPEDYGYDALTGDLRAVLDDLGLVRAVLVGASMGAHTILRLALEDPERVAGLVVVTPGYDPDEHDDPHRLERWDMLSDALRTGGVEGFVAAYGVEDVPEAWRETMDRVLHQRLERHEHPEAVADALRRVPRSRPFAALSDLKAIACPTVVVASRDEADPGHPLALARAYAEHLPGARLLVEDEGQSPLAWQGGRLSKVIAELAADAW